MCSIGQLDAKSLSKISDTSKIRIKILHINIADSHKTGFSICGTSRSWQMEMNHHNLNSRDQTEILWISNHFSLQHTFELSVRKTSSNWKNTESYKSYKKFKFNYLSSNLFGKKLLHNSSHLFFFFSKINRAARALMKAFLVSSKSCDIEISILILTFFSLNKCSASWQHSSSFIAFKLANWNF